MLTSLLLLPSATGCYTYSSAYAGAPLEPGAEVSLDLTDLGRVRLREQVGEGARRIAGRLLLATDSVLVLGVTSVHYLDAPEPARWNGEELRISRELFTNLQTRTFSRSRSWLAAGAAAAGAALLSTIAIVGFGFGDGGGEKPKENGGGGET